MTIGEFLYKNVSPKKTRLITDESNRYDLVANMYDRSKIRHKNKEYVCGDIHTNTIEGFWSHFKRSVKGTHKSISKKHLQAYLDAFVWHYNNRHNDRLRFEILISRLAG